MTSQAKELRAQAAAIRAEAEARALALEGIAERLERVEAATSPDAAQLVGPKEVGVASYTWNAAIRSGALRGTRVGRYYRARRSDVAEWLATLGRPEPKTKVETEESASAALDPFEAARARARARAAA